MNIEKKLPFTSSLTASLHSEVLLAAVHAGGECLARYFGKVKNIRKKGRIDLVTEADVEAEKAIFSVIQATCPEHGIVSEEYGIFQKDSPWQWIVDPLDGTTNFRHGIPWFGVSIALSFHGKLLVGCVHNPIAGDWFLAEREKGAYHGSVPMRVSDTRCLEESMLATGFSYGVREKIESVTGRFARCLYEAQGIRRMGAASLDLCYLAKGSFDGFWEEDLQPWDTAAGTLIAREAGACVTDFEGNPYQIDMKSILATNGTIHQPLKKLLE